MKVLQLGSDAGATQTFLVPAGASSILAFCAAATRGSAGVDTTEGFVMISSDITSTSGNLQNGIARGLLAIANTQFPPIPVSAGEKLLVAFWDVGSAVIYFDEPSL